MRFPVLVVLSLLVAACAGGEVDTPTIEVAAGHPVRMQLEWLAAALEAGAVSETEYADHVSPAWRSKAPLEESFLPVLAEMSRAAGEWHLLALKTESDVRGEGVLAAAGERMRVVIEVEEAPPHRIVDLLVQPVMISLPPATMEEAVDRVRRYGEVSFLAARVEGRSCVSVVDEAASDPIPLAGAVDLFVALAVAEQVAEGELAWHTEARYDPGLRSHPLSATSRLAPGSVLTVEELLMAAVGNDDNTALDHLIDLVGASEMETVMERFTGDQANSPFPASRQIAALKIGRGRQLLSDYAEGSAAERRAILADLDTDLSSPSITGDPQEVRRAEWLASPGAVCRLLVELEELAGRPEMAPLEQALTADPGLAPAAGVWDQVFFSGGAEPGVLTVVWLTRRDSERFVVVGSVVNEEKAFPTVDAVLILGEARDMLSPVLVTVSDRSGR